MPRQSLHCLPIHAGVTVAWDIRFGRKKATSVETSQYPSGSGGADFGGVGATRRCVGIRIDGHVNDVDSNGAGAGAGASARCDGGPDRDR